TEHPGLATLMDRRQTDEEDLIILLSAPTSQFRSAAEILDEANNEADGAGISVFDRAAAEQRLSSARRDIYRAVDHHLEGFARCGIATVDDWADRYRLDRRMPIARALAMLAIPGETWKPPPGQAYVSAILDFFGKKVSVAGLRGPLARMTIGKATP